MSDERGEVTKLLGSPEIATPEMQQRLFRILYAELKRLAGAQIRSERRDHTLSPTALVHEMWLRLAPGDAEFENRRHFLAVSAQAMRRVLIDHARARKSLRRGEGIPLVRLNTAIDPAIPLPDEQIVALDEALTRLAEVNPRAAKVVELRFFGGLTEEQVASTLNVVRRTVNRDWELARAWLFREIRRSAGA